MGKDFEVEIRVQVHDLNDEEVDWLRHDAVDFVVECGAIDDAEFTVTELS